MSYRRGMKERGAECFPMVVPSKTLEKLSSLEFLSLGIILSAILQVNI